MSDERKVILWRVYLVYFSMLMFALAIIGRVLYIQFAEGDYWKELARRKTIRLFNIEATRGNIYDCKGNLLATSVPNFEIRMDVSNEWVSDSYFASRVDSLATCLSKLFRDKSRAQYLSELWKARKSGERYFQIEKDVTYPQLKQLRRFPIFRLGKYKGGLIVIERDKRVTPFQELASRTIGYTKTPEAIDTVYKVGIEGGYNDKLRGISGKKLYQRISGEAWMPISNENEVDPQNGNDIITTLDVNIQDVAENALLSRLVEEDADFGCTVLMEVKTGEIRAIANLKKKAEGVYAEDMNYAIREVTEPGSTFKLFSMVAAMDDGKVDTNDIVNIHGGITTYAGRKMEDSHTGLHNIITARKAFEISSNVGISMLIYRAYADNPKRFTDKLYSMNINQPLGLDIPGEFPPVVKNPANKSWSKTTLPWMSIGYEVALTPLQNLTFYNAIANDGVMVKPRFVREIRQSGVVVQKNEPVIINPAICSPSTARKARSLLEGVVERGTAKMLQNPVYTLAGKTGTAQIARQNAGYREGQKVSYKGFFVGYFPADRPKYSCIVMIYNPTKGKYYGGAVAAPVFKEIADKVYASDLDLREPVPDTLKNKVYPSMNLGFQEDAREIQSWLGVPFRMISGRANPVADKDRTFAARASQRQLNEAVVPDVRGMGAKDAVYQLESNGLKVRMSGKGIVSRQSLDPGTRAKKGTLITIELVNMAQKGTVT